MSGDVTYDKGFLDEILKGISGERVFGYPMGELTSLRVGGPADLIIYPEEVADLMEIVQVCRRSGVPTFILGGGTNLLVRDGGIAGAVISLGKGFRKVELAADGGSEVTIHGGGGGDLPHLFDFAVRGSLSGLEFAAGIPGTIGGGIVMNAGTAQESLSSVIESVEALEPDGTFRKLQGQDLSFDYRSSSFSDGWVVMGGMFRLKRGDRDEIRERSRLTMERKRKAQPLGETSAGCIFKNPPGHQAGKLIEALGLKGLRVGGAEISSFHANFIINRGNAAAADVLALMDIIKDRVLKELGIELQEEVKVIGRC